MRRKREKEVITSSDVGVLEMDSKGDFTVSTDKKCSICGEKYTIFDPKNPRLNKTNNKPARLPNTWTEEEEMAHKIGHVESVKARRVIGGIVALSQDDRKEVLGFINEHFAG